MNVITLMSIEACRAKDNIGLELHQSREHLGRELLSPFLGRCEPWLDGHVQNATWVDRLTFVLNRVLLCRARTRVEYISSFVFEIVKQVH